MQNIYYFNTRRIHRISADRPRTECFIFLKSKVAIVVQHSAENEEEEDEGKTVQKRRDLTAPDYVPHVNALCTPDTPDIHSRATCRDIASSIFFSCRKARKE